MPSISGPCCSGFRRDRWSRKGWAGPNATAFNERYGRIETRITERSGGPQGEDNRMSRGSKSTIKLVRPGIMPALFGRHLIDKAVFLGLSEVADNLPPLEEECLPGPHGSGAGSGLPARGRRAARGGHQGDDEAAGSAPAGRDGANAAGLSRLPIRLGTDRLLGGSADGPAEFRTVATPPHLAGRQ